MYLFIDTETTGKPQSYSAPITDIENWPRIVQLAWATYDDSGDIVTSKCYLIIPEKFQIPEETVKIHGISTERAKKEGIPIIRALNELNQDIDEDSTIIAHNIDFDVPTVNAEFVRNSIKTSLLKKPNFCTMKTKEIILFCKIPNPYRSGYKWPSLPELYKKIFDTPFDGEHDASRDVEACAKCFFQLKERGIICFKNENRKDEAYQELGLKTSQNILK